MTTLNKNLFYFPIFNNFFEQYYHDFISNKLQYVNVDASISNNQINNIEFLINPTNTIRTQTPSYIIEIIKSLHAQQEQILYDAVFKTLPNLKTDDLFYDLLNHTNPILKNDVLSYIVNNNLLVDYLNLQSSVSPQEKIFSIIKHISDINKHITSDPKSTIFFNSYVSHNLKIIDDINPEKIVPLLDNIQASNIFRTLVFILSKSYSEQPSSYSFLLEKLGEILYKNTHEHLNEFIEQFVKYDNLEINKDAFSEINSNYLSTLIKKDFVEQVLIDTYLQVDEISPKNIVLDTVIYFEYLFKNTPLLELSKNSDFVSSFFRKQMSFFQNSEFTGNIIFHASNEGTYKKSNPNNEFFFAPLADQPNPYLPKYAHLEITIHNNTHPINQTIFSELQNLLLHQNTLFNNLFSINSETYVLKQLNKEVKSLIEAMLSLLLKKIDLSLESQNIPGVNFGRILSINQQELEKELALSSRIHKLNSELDFTIKTTNYNRKPKI